MTLPNRVGPTTAKQVEELHRLSDLNKRREAQHHTLGTGPTEASPGNHTHDGANSKLLLDGVVITGNKITSVPAILTQIMAALSELGLTDATT